MQGADVACVTYPPSARLVAITVENFKCFNGRHMAAPLHKVNVFCGSNGSGALAVEFLAKNDPGDD